MSLRHSLNSKRSENTASDINCSFNQKENNQKNLNRSKNLNKLSNLEHCLLIKPLDSKNYMTNANTNSSVHSSYTTNHTANDTRVRLTARSYRNPLFSSPVQTKKPISDTQQYCQLYGRDILAESENNPQRKTNFLESHQINSVLRARMLDWMVQVIESYKFTHKTYFASVNLMDRYLAQISQSVPVSDLHILGVTSMYVAAKMQEVYPLKLKTVYEKIVHKKISKQELTNMEMKLFEVLGHKTNSWTFFDLAILKIFDKANISDEAEKQRVESILSYVSKFLTYDYELYTKYDQNTLANVAAHIYSKICGLSYQGEFSSECNEDLSNTYRNFRQNFKGMNNLFKFADEQTVNLVNAYFSTLMY